ncbi:MAG: glycosyltransferase family 4 protein [Candidatus Sericytochromatia bacterium]|nr:glycosyltransferase family 4 protein [Candidatus Sericytochromatia bacterium]
MRIALVCPRLPPHPGGVADHAARWAEAIATHLGHEVIALTGPGASSPGVPGVRLAPPVEAWGLAAPRSLPAAIAAVAPDLVVLQYVPQLYERRGFSLGIALAARTVALAGWPLLTTAHELCFGWPEGLRHAPAGLVQRLALVPLVRASRRLVVTVAAREAALRRAFPSLAGRFKTLPVGPNLPPLPGVDRAAWRRARGWTAEEIVLVFQGGAHPSKDREALLAALEGLDAAGLGGRLVCLGGAPPVAHPRVTGLGQLEEREAREALSAADVALAPFLDGASGRRSSLANALACGLAVVSTEGHHTDPAWARAEAMRLAPAGDPAAFARAVVSVVADEATRRRLGAAAARFAAATLGWDVLARAWAPLLEEALKPPAAPGASEAAPCGAASDAAEGP